MRIIVARKISRAFFLLLFVWFCLVTSVGVKWWQIRGWPVNLFLQLDPLIALTTILTTKTLYAGLWWAIATIVLTIVLGRFFCGWVCPFGTLQQFAGLVTTRDSTDAQQIEKRISKNRYHPAQTIKYFLLLFFLGAAAAEFLSKLPSGISGLWLLAGAIGSLAASRAILAITGLRAPSKKPVKNIGSLFSKWVPFVAACLFVAWCVAGQGLAGASLQIGLLDPICLVSRSVNLVLLPIFQESQLSQLGLASSQRFTVGALIIGTIFAASLLLCLRVPRFYCRFVCPLGALFGILGRYSIWRVGTSRAQCEGCGQSCNRCSISCEGACEPSGKIRINECILCMNCLWTCPRRLISYRTSPSAAGELITPDLSKRGFMVSLVSGIAYVPIVRMAGGLEARWPPALIRPPGALVESDFLRRCVKCGQCMRICPTNIIQPAISQGGLEGLWTPVLDFRAGTSGCQYSCVACSRVCPSAAIRFLSLDEKQGRNSFSAAGPIRLGTAFVNRGRCLPWAMDKPCIVCQEVCPLTPKAIFTREHFVPIRSGRFTVEMADNLTLTVSHANIGGAGLIPGSFAKGDYYCREILASDNPPRRKILWNSERQIVLSPDHHDSPAPSSGSLIDIEIRLRQPHVDLDRCIGCGTCEHECPVAGRKAIRITAENESRSRRHRLLLG